MLAGPFGPSFLLLKNSGITSYSYQLYLTFHHWPSLILKVKVKLLSRVQLFVTRWTVAHQAPLPMGFSRQEYWSGLPSPSPGDLTKPGIEPRSPALQADSLTSEPPGKPFLILLLHKGVDVISCKWGRPSLPISPSCQQNLLTVIYNFIAQIT